MIAHSVLKQQKLQIVTFSTTNIKILFNKLTCLDLNLSGNKAALFCIDHFLFHDVLISEYTNKTVEKIPQLIAFHAYVLLLH
jgi:hypothetical protein